MTISGAAIIRNGVRLGYPFIASIKSVLPLTDEFIVGVGDSDDDTRARIAAIGDPRIKIIDTVWDMRNRSGGTVLSVETNRVLRQCTGDWIFYIQSDEAVHEADHGQIRAAVAAAERRNELDGLFFRYHHFYGSYATVQPGRNWYRREVRLIRNGRGTVSHGDAQGFRRNGEKIRAADSGAWVYHYGWARPPAVMMEKIKSFHQFWHDDAWIQQHCANADVAAYFTDLGNLRPFTGTHPAVMREIIAGDSPAFISACRERYLQGRSLSAAVRDWVRNRPFGGHDNFTPCAG
jgi:glycosyltransferase involved in cell wall biosynthesis